jgi:hypothetical protein
LKVLNARQGEGRVDLYVARHAADAVATELGVAAASVDQMYQPAL